ncbi:hypothetical protein V6Z11_D12G160500 [Gossypium hirsutum]
MYCLLQAYYNTDLFLIFSASTTISHSVPKVRLANRLCFTLPSQNLLLHPTLSLPTSTAVFFKPNFHRLRSLVRKLMLPYTALKLKPIDVNLKLFFGRLNRYKKFPSLSLPKGSSLSLSLSIYLNKFDLKERKKKTISFP